MLTVLCLAFILIFGAAFTSIRPTGSSIATNPAEVAGDDLSGLPGTDWAMLPYQTMPDIFAFCPSGRWELQSSAAFGGRYQVSGKRVLMKLDDGSTYADCTLAKREGDDIYLSCGSDSLHLRYHGKNNCK